DHPHGGERPRAGPVAELPFRVPAPAPHRAVAKERAGVVAPAADGGDTGESAHPHGGGRTAPRPIAELPVVVPPPALHRAVREERTGVIRTSGDGVRAGASDPAPR